MSFPIFLCERREEHVTKGCIGRNSILVTNRKTPWFPSFLCQIGCLRQTWLPMTKRAVYDQLSCLRFTIHDSTIHSHVPNWFFKCTACCFARLRLAQQHAFLVLNVSAIDFNLADDRKTKISTDFEHLESIWIDSCGLWSFLVHFLLFSRMLKIWRFWPIFDRFWASGVD